MIEKVNCPEYFDVETTCASCETRIKRENQIVCDYCHENKLQPEWLEGE